MDIVTTEFQLPFHPPSEDARLILFANDEIHSGAAKVGKHLTLCAKYAAQYSVYTVSGLCAYEDRLWLCMFDPNGKPLIQQGAIHLALPLQNILLPYTRIEVVHTELGNICLCVDTDILHPQILRAAALKGADLILSIQRLDPADDTPERLMCSVWNAAQSNNVYVVNYSAGGCMVACPAPLTRAGDGYLVRKTSSFPARFGLNLLRLEETRDKLQILENINTGLVKNYATELGG